MGGHVISYHLVVTKASPSSISRTLSAFGLWFAGNSVGLLHDFDGASYDIRNAEFIDGLEGLAMKDAKGHG